MESNEIKHPRRLLIVSAPGCDVVDLVKDLTGSAPTVDTTGSIAGVTHEWHISNNYYSANIPIWLDEITDLDEWATEFSKPEAREVVEAVGGWIYCIDRNLLTNSNADDVDEPHVFDKTIKAIEGVINKACGYSWEGIKLAVAVSSSSKKTNQTNIVSEEWDDRCMEYGFEFVDAQAQGKNDFGEKTGIQRLKEALEASDWSAADGDDDDADGTLGGFEDEEREMSSELWGLKASLLGIEDEDADGELGTGGDEALQVDNLEQLMSQALAIKESGAELPLEERRKFAARAVNKMMKDL